MVRLTVRVDPLPLGSVFFVNFIHEGARRFFNNVLKKTALFVAFLNANFNHFAILQTAPSTSTSICLLLGALKTKI